MRLDYIDASPLTSCETNCASTNGYAIFSRVTHSAHSFTFIRVGASICAMCIRICPMPSYMTIYEPISVVCYISSQVPS